MADERLNSLKLIVLVEVLTFIDHTVIVNSNKLAHHYVYLVTVSATATLLKSKPDINDLLLTA